MHPSDGYEFPPVSEFRPGERIHFYAWTGVLEESGIVGHCDGTDTYRLDIDWPPGCPIARIQYVAGTRTFPVELPRPQVIDWDEEDARAARYDGEAA